MTFLGYVRPDGTIGIRNYILVIPDGMVAGKICEFVNGTKTIITSDTGSGRTKRDRETIGRVLVGLGQNPNVAGVIVHGTSFGSGYPELHPENIAHQIAETGKPVEVIGASGDMDILRIIEKGIKLAREMVYNASKIRRGSVPDSFLTLGVKCGHSDTTSGIAGNPVVGYVYDKLVSEGGTALFGETTEIIGAEHILAKRAINKEVAQQILEAARLTEERAKSTGEDIRTINPVPSNIAGGITTLEEKSLGAIAKAGKAPIQGVLEYGEKPKGKGLFFVDNWMTYLSIFVGYAGAGANLVLFQLGGGGRAGDTLLYPSSSVVTPLLWTTANPRTFQRTIESMDFYSGTVIEGKESISEAGERLYRMILDVASGTMTKVETINYSYPVQIYLQDTPF